MQEPTLYILMRDDLESLNAGKAIAQGSHATNDFEEWARYHEAKDDFQPVREWRDDRSFGRCLTVAAKPHQIDKIMTMMDESDDVNFGGGIIVDPTYPVTDGEVIHKIDLLTCGWVFVWDSESYADQRILRELKKLPLYG
jgi:peptidyl-tRNA hydrolase